MYYSIGNISNVVKKYDAENKTVAEIRAEYHQKTEKERKAALLEIEKIKADAAKKMGPNILPLVAIGAAVLLGGFYWFKKINYLS